MWPSKWTPMKVLFFLTRYSVFIDCAFIIYRTPQSIIHNNLSFYLIWRLDHAATNLSEAMCGVVYKTIACM